MHRRCPLSRQVFQLVYDNILYSVNEILVTGVIVLNRLGTAMSHLEPYSDSVDILDADIAIRRW